MICLFPAIHASAGKLGDVEADVLGERPATAETEGEPESEPHEGVSGHHAGKQDDSGSWMRLRDDEQDSIGDAMGRAWLGMLARASFFVVGYGGVESWNRASGDNVMDSEFAFNVPPRKTGESTIPFVRIDVSYQDVERDVDSMDVRAEAGYGPFAVEVRETHYNESVPSDHLDLVRIHLLYRTSYAAILEVDAGLGALIFNGDRTESSWSFTLPVLIHPTDIAGLEFRPSWAEINDNRIVDYDLGLILGWRYVAVRTGYRWMESEREDLNGPFIGATFRW
jgi:hypothetical protein